MESTRPTALATLNGILNGLSQVAFPPKCKGNAEELCLKTLILNDVEDLIKALCRSEPSERLAMKKGGTRNVKTRLGERKSMRL